MDRSACISLYFHLGLGQREILDCLAYNHGIVISQRHLRRLLRGQGLSRRAGQSDPFEVAMFIQGQLQTCGQNYGYRWMHLRCIQEGLVVTQSTVRAVQQLLDPEGVSARRRHRLVRRRYCSSGPNQTWHMDGYDKMKPFGVAVHGCIDGYSRNIIWLEAYTTNNDPRVILHYYLKSVSAMKGCPRRIRADCGTENGLVQQAQTFLRRNGNDRMAGPGCFLYGKSTTNQRIESWWCMLRRQCAQYWLDILHTLREDGHFNGGFLHKNLIQFCFMKLIQDDLDQVVHLWNTHSMRADRKLGRGRGRPIMFYTLPELYGAEDKLVDVYMQEVVRCQAESTPKRCYPCARDVFDLCCILMEENGWAAPNDGYEAGHLYLLLKDRIQNDLGI